MYEGIVMSVGFSFLLMRNPDEWNDSTDRQTNLALGYASWEALFFKVLGCPDTELVEGTNPDARDEYWEAKFREAIPDFPLLGRISDFFRDVWYDPAELAQLRNECQRVRNKTNDKDAIEGLDALIAGCDEAQQSNLGLFLGAD
jgi:hypothetical protein